MQRKYLIEDKDNQRLVIFFTGWSTDYKIIENIILPKGYDLLCIWDYRQIDNFVSEKPYVEIIVIAWSFGVKAAEIALTSGFKNFNVTGKYAIAGSVYPVDDNCGIPKQIFNATLSGLSEQSLKKFRLRICGSRDKWAQYSETLVSDMSIEELRKELEVFKEIGKVKIEPIDWDYVFIVENDRIFPAENLKNAWKNSPYKILPEDSHLPDFQSLFNLIIKDKSTIGKKFENSFSDYDNNAIIQNELSDSLIQIIKEKECEVKDVLEIGGGTGYLNKILHTDFLPQSYTIVDLAQVKDLPFTNIIKEDIETAICNIPDSSFDLVLSGSTIQWLHSPLNLMKEVKRCLKTGGKFIFSTFIEGTFKEIKELTGKSLLYLTEEQWRLLGLKTGMEIEFCKAEEKILWFENSKEVMKHLRTTGVNSLTGKTKTVSEIRHLMNNYPKKDGLYPLTYYSLVMVLRKP